MAAEYDKTIFSQNGVACNVQFYKHLWLDVVTSPDGNAMEVITVRFTPTQARELAAMLLEAADAADGVPARPVRIEDVPLSYVQRADSAQEDETFPPHADHPDPDDMFHARDWEQEKRKIVADENRSEDVNDG